MQDKDKDNSEQALAAEEILMRFTASAMQEESLTQKIQSLTELQEKAQKDKQRYYLMYVAASGKPQS
ncbi:hypothetical protein [Runella sp.]|uniref:hypothetical protein n=1 Tax=Runella sp. TaxID=1960881 RepID=UPI003D0BB6F5